MNKPLNPQDVTEPKVTTGPLSGSRKVYSSPEGHADLQRAAARDRAAAGEPPFHVYDTSGPYTDPDASDRRAARAAAFAQALDRGAQPVVP